MELSQILLTNLQSIINRSTVDWDENVKGVLVELATCIEKLMDLERKLEECQTNQIMYHKECNIMRQQLALLYKEHLSI